MHPATPLLSDRWLANRRAPLTASQRDRRPKEEVAQKSEMMGDENTVAKPERRKGNENQRHEKTRSKNTDVMGDDANPGMRKIFIGKGARRRDAVGKMRTDARRESLSVRDTRPALYFNIAHYSLLTF